jgi:hypothetical protein
MFGKFKYFGQSMTIDRFPFTVYSFFKGVSFVWKRSIPLDIVPDMDSVIIALKIDVLVDNSLILVEPKYKKYYSKLQTNYEFCAIAFA